MNHEHQRQRRKHFSPLTLLQLVALLFAIFEGTSSSTTYNITNADELIAFSKSVNNGGTSFDGTTVFLTEDIDFSSSTNGFEPIGKTESVNSFVGVFDGQGHIIKNFVVDSPDFRYTGLFGYSEGLTIKNVVIDETCSFANRCPSNEQSAFVSSLIGTCKSGAGKVCVIENVVNMATISFNGGSKTYIIPGGISGKCFGNCIVSNCVNFGSILMSLDGISTYIFSGGIIGEVHGSSGSVTIKNCINYGSITNNAVGNTLVAIGGIVGAIWSNIVIENCLSAGPVLTIGSSSGSLFVGSVMGEKE